MKNCKRYFTLTEVILVVTVMLIAGSMYGFFISKARRDAAGVKCAENLFKMGKATFRYAADNKGELPYASWDEVNWKTQIARYMEKEKNVFLCPADKNKMPLYMEKDPFYKGHVSYTANHYVIDIRNFDSNNDDFITTRKLAGIDGPDTVILYGENHNGRNSLVGALSVNWDKKGKYFYPEAARKGYHSEGNNNYLLLDGGVEFYTYGRTLYPENLWLLKYGKSDL